MKFLKRLHPSIYIIVCLLLVCVPMMGLISSCSDATSASWAALGAKHRVQLFSGGKVVGEWESTGKINNEAHSDGYYFKDDKTGKLVAISGTVIITVE